MRTPLSQDTDPEVERLQVEAWQCLSPREKAALITALTRAVRAMAWAGVQHRHPDATAREQFLRLAIETLGPELASAAYPDAAALVSS